LAIKINIGVTKKVGQPNYGSRGASCHVEFELDGSWDTAGAARFQEAALKAYASCRQAVDTELAQPEVTAVVSPNSSINGAFQATHGEANEAAPSRRATASQIRAIHAIAKRGRVQLHALLARQYHVDQVEKLSIRDASQVIDQLKSVAEPYPHADIKGASA
jgi:hypothetical protein